MKARNITETRVVYEPEEETYAQRQLREFFVSHQKRSAIRRRKPAPKAPWAPKYDPLNGKTAGTKEKIGPFGKVAE
jgi:hypothetical protein